MSVVFDHAVMIHPVTQMIEADAFLVEMNDTIVAITWFKIAVLRCDRHPFLVKWLQAVPSINQSRLSQLQTLHLMLGLFPIIGTSVPAVLMNHPKFVNLHGH